MTFEDYYNHYQISKLLIHIDASKVVYFFCHIQTSLIFHKYLFHKWICDRLLISITATHIQEDETNEWYQIEKIILCHSFGDLYCDFELLHHAHAFHICSITWHIDSVTHSKSISFSHFYLSCTTIFCCVICFESIPRTVQSA